MLASRVGTSGPSGGQCRYNILLLSQLKQKVALGPGMRADDKLLDRGRRGQRLPPAGTPMEALFLRCGAPHWINEL